MIVKVNNKEFDLDDRLNKGFNLLQARDLNEFDIRGYIAASGYIKADEMIEKISNEELNKILKECIEEELLAFGGEGVFE